MLRCMPYDFEGFLTAKLFSDRSESFDLGDGCHLPVTPMTATIAHGAPGLTSSLAMRVAVESCKPRLCSFGLTGVLVLL